MIEINRKLDDAAKKRSRDDEMRRSQTAKFLYDNGDNKIKVRMEHI